MDLANLLQSLSLNVPEPPNVSSFRVYACKINGQHTDIGFANSGNRFILLASQYEKLGHLFKVTVDLPKENIGDNTPVYTVTTLLGSSSIEQEATARYFAEQLQVKEALLLFLSLREYSQTTIKELLEACKHFIKKESEAQ